MAEMSRYCKAYLAEAFRAFPGWDASADLSDLQTETVTEDGRETEVPRGALRDDHVLYLHDDFRVTDGIFRDEHVVFDAVTTEWREFCAAALDFQVPELSEAAAADPAPAPDPAA